MPSSVVRGSSGVMKPVPFGNYYLLDRINIGGMAEVFRAKAYGAAGFERLLAVKRILESISRDREFIHMFIDEAKIAVQLSHANIAQVFDLGQVDGMYYIAMEYVPGKDLRAVFERCHDRSEAMSLPHACLAVMKMCEGLDYAHNKRDASGKPMRLVHRDVSPQNILISYEGEVKIIDFGVAKAVGNHSHTHAGVLKGKFPYMSPEQVRGLPIDCRSDVFSVGVILFELLTGQRLFFGETDFAILEMVRNAEIPQPRAINPEIPEKLEQILYRALAKDVDDRYQQAIDLHDDLQAFLYGVGVLNARTELAGWMRHQFAHDIEEERIRINAFDDLVLPPRKPLAAFDSGLGMLDFEEGITEQTETSDLQRQMVWEEDIETEIYENDDVPTEVPDKLVGRQRRNSEAISLLADKPMVVLPSSITASSPALPRVTTNESMAPTQRDEGSNLAWVAIVGACCVLLLALGGFVVYKMRQTGSITVSATPKDSRIYVDGVLKGIDTPLTVLDLKAGYYVVEARRPGFRPWKRVVSIRGGKSTAVDASLVETGYGTLDVRTEPTGAVVVIDEIPVSDLTPVRISNVSPGLHQLRVFKLPGYQVETRQISIRPGVTHAVNLVLNRAETRALGQRTPPSQKSPAVSASP